MASMSQTPHLNTGIAVWTVFGKLCEPILGKTILNEVLDGAAAIALLQDLLLLTAGAQVLLTQLQDVRWKQINSL